MRRLVNGFVSRICTQHPYSVLAACRFAGAAVLVVVDVLMATANVPTGIILAFHGSQTYLISVGMSALTLRLSKINKAA